MTVCIAAIYEHRGLIVASDRKITMSDTEVSYESTQPKIFGLADNILALAADDMSLQGEILFATKKRLQASFPDAPVGIKVAADTYWDAYNELRLEYAEREILKPQGLTRSAWEAGRDSGTLSEVFVSEITREFANYSMPVGVETILAGIDTDGYPRIYVLRNHEDPRCESIRGFAAIGAGWRNAEAQFSYAGFNRMWPMVDTCFLTYLAKKRSQVVLGVGDETTMFAIRANKKYKHLLEREYKILEKEYKRLEAGIRRYEETARNRVRKAVNQTTDAETVLGEFEVW